jgi:hypothetical protein
MSLRPWVRFEKMEGGIQKDHNPLVPVHQVIFCETNKNWLASEKAKIILYHTKVYEYFTPTTPLNQSALAPDAASA